MSARRQAGRRANRKGRAWEAQLMGLTNRYRLDGQAVIGQTFPDGKKRRGLVDLVGHLADGRSFWADAKSTSKKRWSFDLLETHQAKLLRDVGRLPGAVTGLLIRTAEGTKAEAMAWVPWELVEEDWFRWRKHGGAPASITADIGIPIEKDQQGLPDWLPAVLHGA